ncbi:MAG: DNA mismatch repair endonuclease MutL [Endomicrobia bacterium]|nr:DNA mismatch repair endonuclease MutL [Endomicrobiia bacterium]
MNKIKILPPEIYTRIAAGEVIERPSNVVKELLENSIDASSSKITIEIIDAGKKLIRVSDNGCGMSKEDITLCIKPHSTSKIENFEDIYKLSTLGFRGEALSSIVNVSKTKIISKTNESQIGYQLTVHGGEIISFKECSTNTGTIIEVTDLFYNVPARLKFLKSNYTEKTHIIKTIEEYAVAYYNIEFKFFSDNELVFSFKNTNSLTERIKEVFKKDFTKNIIYFENIQNEYKLYGFVSPVEYTQVNKFLQIFYVNKRPITSKILTQALYDAYKDILPTGRHPIGIIFIELPPDKVDVNVHPKKRIVKFLEEEFLYQKLRDTISEKIKKYNIETKKSFIITNTNLESDIISEKNTLEVYFQSIQPPERTEDFHLLKLKDNQKIGLYNYTYLGQLNRTYLLFETNNGLTIIDQHAASERILFEKFILETSKASLQIQKLLFPVNLELKFSDFEIIKPYIEELNNLGFETIISGKTSLGFYGIPSIIKINDIKDFILKFIENLLSDIKSEITNISPKEKIIRSACKAAIKAKELLNLQEAEQLLEGLFKCSEPFFCPHGRPTIVNIEINEIEKMFLRQK